MSGACDGAAAAQDARIRLVRHEENQGPSGARNTGIAAARGSYVWMPDPDDMYDPELLEGRRAAIAMGAGVPTGGVVDPASFPLRPNTSCDVVEFGCREEYRAGSGSLRVRECLCGRWAARSSARMTSMHPCVTSLQRILLRLSSLPRDEARFSLTATSTARAFSTSRSSRSSGTFGTRSTAERSSMASRSRMYRSSRTSASISRLRVVWVRPPWYVVCYIAIRNARMQTLRTNSCRGYYEVHHRCMVELFEVLRGWGLDGTDARSRLGRRAREVDCPREAEFLKEDGKRSCSLWHCTTMEMSCMAVYLAFVLSLR